MDVKRGVSKRASAKDDLGCGCEPLDDELVDPLHEHRRVV
jgi:hypothetical protein